MQNLGETLPMFRFGISGALIKHVPNVIHIFCEFFFISSGLFIMHLI